MGSLSNLYISQSYQSLIHLGTNNTASATLIGLEDGLGNSIGVSVNTAGNLYLSGTFSASLQEGYLYVGNASGRTIAFPTSSLVATVDTASLVSNATFNAYTASTDIRLSNIEIATASIIVSVSNLNAYTQSNDAKWQDLGNKSGSWITESETSSFARTNVDNNFTANQTFTNITAVSASITYLTTIFETASVIFSSGSNQLGDELTDIQTLSGSVKVQGSLTINGVPVQTSSVDISALNQATQSLQAFTQSANIRLNNLEAATSSYAISSSVAAVDAAQQAQIDSLISATGSYITEGESGSFLITASFASQTLTFTKGDGTTFDVIIPDISGSTIDTGSFATTGSNSFVGNQFITGAVYVSGALGAIDLDTVNGFISLYNYDEGTSVSMTVTSATGNLSLTANGDEANISDGGAKWWYATNDGQGNYSSLHSERDIVITGSFTASLQEGYVWVGDGNGISTTVATSSFGGGSPINTGSFATTGSNTFRGSQTINVQGSNNEFNLISDNQTNINFQSAGSNFAAYGDFAFNNNGQYGGSGSVKFLARNNEIIFAADGGFQLGQTNGIGNGIGAGSIRINVPTGSNKLELTGSLSVSDTFTASLQQGHVFVGDANNRTITVSTSSFGGGGTTFAFPSVQTISGSFVLIANGFTSGAANLLHITGSTPNFSNLIFKNNNNTGTTFVTGSNNIFTNPGAPAAGYIRYVGGSSNLFLNGNRDSAVTVSLPLLTGSAASVSGARPAMNGNIIVGNPLITINQSTTPGIYNLNNNVFNGTFTINSTGQVGAGSAQLGRLDYTGNTIIGNVTLNFVSRSIAQINAGETGSARANITNNTILGTFTYNGPVSASATAQIHTISANNIAGNLTMNVQSGSKAYSVTNNNINGTVTINDNTVFTPTLGSTAGYSNNIINGTATFNARNSGSFAITSNNINTWTISSDADLSAITVAGSRLASLNGNALFGASANNILFSGSATGSVDKRVQNNLMAGSNISASVGGGTEALLATSVLGNGLTVFGTNLFNNTNNTFGGANNGSLFAGRWNVNELPRAGTAETVFAIGTGTSGSAGIVRKTGFLIDSGSNTFVEGTFNVSGSTSLNGNLTITGSLTASLANGFTYVGNASGITTAVETGSIVVATASFANNASDIVVTVKNTTGAQIDKGTVVRITGATGDNALIGTASWEDDNNSANTLGFVVTDIPNDSFGRVMTQGTLLSINTDPALGYTAGQIVYLSGSGQYTNIKPPAPYHEVRLGQVLRAQQNNGSIYVLIQNGYELGELHDVDILTGSLANNDLLAYNSSSTQWENKSFGVLGLAITGSNSFQGVQEITGSLIVSASAGQAATAYEMIPATNAFFVYNYTEEIPGHEVYMNAQTATGSISIKAYDTHTAIADTSGGDAIRFELDGTSGVSINQPLFVTGAVTISDVISLAQLDPLPGGADGQLAVSASNLWFYSGSAWNQIAFV